MNKEPINHLPLHDEASGIRELNQRHQTVIEIGIGGTLALGMIVGALIVYGLVVTLTR